MTESLTELSEGFNSAFRDYLNGPGGAAFHAAYDLGRRAVDEGLGVLNLATMYQEVLAANLLRADPADATMVAMAAAVFFSEALSPFEITHRSYQEANTALQSSEMRYRELVENANDIIFSFDLQGNFSSINCAGERISGYTRSEAVGMHVSRVLASEYLNLLRQTPGTKLVDGQASTYEVQLTTKDGRNVPLEVSIRLIRQDGRPIGVQGIARDITERKQAEQNERENEERFHLMVHSIRDYAIFMLTSDGRIASWNNGAQRLFRYTVRGIVGAPLPSIYPSDDVQLGMPEHHLRMAEEEGRVEYEGWRVRKDGSRFWASTVLTALREPDGPLRGFVNITHDMTERRNADEALRRMNEVLEEQVHRIAHALHDESGQLLASVHIALSELAAELPPHATKRLTKIEGLLELIEEQIREFSHELRPTILDDLGLVPALKFLANGVSRRTRIMIDVHCEAFDRLPPPVETALYRITQEALTNISRHSKATRMAIRMIRQGEVLRCSIKDNGIGFDVPAVFNRKGQRGMGLSGIEARLDALHGTISIRSAPGQGTELLFSVPLARKDVYSNPIGR